MQGFSLDYVLLYFRLAIEERSIEGWVEGCLERIGKDDPDEEQFFRVYGRTRRSVRCC